MVLNLTHHILFRLQRSRAIKQSWKRLIAATTDINGDSSFSGMQSRDGSEYVTAALQNEGELTYALETILSLSQEEREYMALLSEILLTLDTGNPLSIAFLNHIIDRAALPSKTTISNISDLILRKLQKSKKNSNENTIKMNASVLWAILAERFAGDLCMSLWKDEIGDELLAILACRTESCSVRIFALIALEKFALTGTIKNFILSRPLDVNDLLQSVIKECQQKYCSTAPSLKTSIETEANIANANNDIGLMPLHNFSQLYKSLGLPRRNSTNAPRPSSDRRSFAQESMSLHGAQEIVSRLQRWSWIFSANHSLRSLDMDLRHDNAKQKAPLREDTALFMWTKYRQLEHCAWWAVSYIFDNTEIPHTWDLDAINITMNPLDATSRWKMGSSGLELRNDHPNFESVRATANVKVGKWYYEVLALTDGIMQVGWATERCHFAPEEGLGVGDDNNGFGFDSCRSTIWANGTAVYPPTASIPPCKPGDVIGTYLDLDNGICTFFINGKDYGLTVEFDQPRKQVYETNKARKQKYSKDGRLIKDVEGLGLYPAISLTSHQHIIINFGNQPWMCPPPSLLVDEFQPMAACEPMSPELKHNILKLTRLRGRKCARVPMSSLGRQAAEISGRTWLDSDSESDTLSASDEKEQVFCTICYSEPHCIQLQPCGHDGLCKTCAKMLTTCPLCRSTITKRKFVEQAMSSSSTLSVSSAALSETNNPVVPIFTLPKATHSSLHLALNTIEEMHERFA